MEKKKFIFAVEDGNTSVMKQYSIQASNEKEAKIEFVKKTFTIFSEYFDYDDLVDILDPSYIYIKFVGEQSNAIIEL